MIAKVVGDNIFPKKIQLAMRSLVAVALVVVAPRTVCNEVNAQELRKTQPVVIVELFTSEGCSSCPPADQVLRKLEEEQPVDKVHIITLGEHVPYWNDLGWSDPFSAKIYEDRQRHYAALLKGSSLYTPQMIVDGQREFIGSDYDQSLSEIKASSIRPKAELTFAATKVPPGQVAVRGQILRSGVMAGRQCDIYLAVVEDNLSSSVARGENSGRRLEHAAVVRQLSLIGKSSLGTSSSFQTTISIAPLWKTKDLRLVVFAQDKGTGAIVGAAEQAWD